VCTTTYQLDTKSNPNLNPNPNPATKKHLQHLIKYKSSMIQNCS